MYKKGSSFSGLEVHASQNRIKNATYLFFCWGEIYTAVFYGPGPGNACSEVSPSYQHHRKTEFCCPKDESLEPHGSRLFFPVREVAWADPEQRAQGKPRRAGPGSPSQDEGWGRGQPLQPRGGLCCTNASALWEHRLAWTCRAQARGKLLGG